MYMWLCYLMTHSLGTIFSIKILHLIQASTSLFLFVLNIHIIKTRLLMYCPVEGRTGELSTPQNISSQLERGYE